MTNKVAHTTVHAQVSENARWVRVAKLSRGGFVSRLLLHVEL